LCDIVLEPRLDLWLNRGDDAPLVGVASRGDEIPRSGEKLSKKVFIEGVPRARKRPIITRLKPRLAPKSVARTIRDDTDRLGSECAPGIVAPSLTQDLYPGDMESAELLTESLWEVVGDLDVDLPLLRGGSEKVALREGSRRDSR